MATSKSNLNAVEEEGRPLIVWKLNRIMAEKRVTGTQLAKMLGVHPNTVSKLRTTDRMPSIDGDRLAKICESLQCDFTDLIEQTNHGYNG